MPQSIRISHGSWNSLYPFLIGLLVLLAGSSGCMSRAPSLRMLETRAGYNAGPDDEEVALYERGRHAQDSILKRSSPRVAKVYIFPHELPTRDYFWGGYVSLLVAQDQWVFDEQEENKQPVAGIREIKFKHPRKRAKTQKTPNS